MSRAARTARGTFGALIATFFAAASHALAGDDITPVAVLATSLFALPLCVLLAGKVGSLWRLSVAVLAAQFVYHWFFSSLGLSSTSSAVGTLAEPVSPHAAHLGMLPATLLTAEAPPLTADAWMWVAHGLAALATITLMHRGERGVMHLVQVLRHAVPVRVPSPVRLPEQLAILTIFTALPSRAERVFLSAMSHRGPPVRLAFTHALLTIQQH